MAELRHVGRSNLRPDTPDKAAGRAHYIQDLARPGMLHGKIKFAGLPSARIVRIDTRRAGRLPGVRAVLTGATAPEVRLGFQRDNVALKRDRVRSCRDEVAAVAAIDPDIAAEAIDLIEVEYEPLPAVFDPESALAPDAPLVHEVDGGGRPRTSNLLDLAFRHCSGDLEAGRRAARHVASGTFSTPRIQQACMGTAGCIAEFDRSGNLTMWAKTQIPFLAQRDFVRALEALGLGGRHVRVRVPPLGGAFGSGLDTHCYEYIAILLAHATGQPVKILYDRGEEFAHLSPRQGTQVRIEQGCDAEGRLTFRDVDVLQDNGAYVSWGATYPSVMMLPATSLYRVPNVRFDSCIVYTNNTYCQAMRGYGNPELTWALESNLDDLAEAAGIDPLEIRLINCNEPGETTPMGLQVTTCGLRECLETVGQRLDWPGRAGRGGGGAAGAPGGHAGTSEPGGPGEPVDPRGHIGRRLRRGMGMAALMHVGGSGRIYRSDASGIILRMDDYGNVYVNAGGVEMGQGLHAALTVGVAECLGVLPERVFINETDTATCPWDVGTHASRGAFTALAAAGMAAADLRRRITALAVKLYPAEVEANWRRYARQNPGAVREDFDFAAAAGSSGASDRFELADGWLRLRDGPDAPWARVELGRFLRAAHFRDGGGTMLTAEAFYDPPTELPDWRLGRGNLSVTYAYGAQGVEVEVDEETGEVHILRVVAAHDVGRVLHRQALEGQIYGALAQGIGYALCEEVLCHEGHVQNPSFTDYKIPGALDMSFPIELVFVETNDPDGPFGAKGAGESGMVPTAPAIANAVADALGVRVHDLPMTPEKVLAALRARETAVGP